MLGAVIEDFAVDLVALTATCGWRSNPATSRSSSARGTTPPVGLAGLLMIRRRVLGVIFAKTLLALNEKPALS